MINGKTLLKIIFHKHKIEGEVKVAEFKKATVSEW